MKKCQKILRCKNAFQDSFTLTDSFSCHNYDITSFRNNVITNPNPTTSNTPRSVAIWKV